MSVNDLAEIPVIQSLDDVSTKSQVTTFKYEQPIVLHHRQSIDFLIVGTKDNDKIVGLQIVKFLRVDSVKIFSQEEVVLMHFSFRSLTGLGNKRQIESQTFTPKMGILYLWIKRSSVSYTHLTLPTNSRV